MAKKLLLLLIIILVAATAANIWINRGIPSVRSEAGISAAIPVENSGENAGETADTGPAIGGAFTLIDQNGREVKDSDFRGRMMLVFFGFTHCPDICPTTLSTLTNVMNTLGEAAPQVVPVLISVDPARDTPQRLKEYLADFHPSVVGLTGTQQAVDEAVKAYKVYAAKQPAEAKEETHSGSHDAHGGGQENYNVDHSGYVYLMDRDGRYLTHFAYNDPEEKFLAAIREQLQ